MKLNAPKQISWVIALILGILGLLGTLVTIPVISGLAFWLVLVGRALWPALRTNSDSKHITMLFFLSTVAIGLFYGAALLWNRRHRQGSIG